MKKNTIAVSLMVFTALLSACGGATSTPAGTSTPLPPAIQQPTEPTSSGQQPTSTVTTALDPCVLVPIEEASKLAGVAFGAGLESTTSGGARICTYGGQTANVFMVEVAQAKDVADAQAQKAQFLADLEANAQQLAAGGLAVTEVPNFADGATIGTLSISAGGETISGSAIGVLKGTVFFGFSDIAVGGTAPTTDALTAEATTVLGRLP